MKKSSKILGSVALSAALVMGTAAPAFADQPDNYSTLQEDLGVAMDEGVRLPMNSGSNDMTSAKAEGASTLVQVGTYTSQINVTIPISLPLYFDTVGGSGIGPKDGTYKIVNNSTADITVQSAKYAMKSTAATDWHFGPSSYAVEGADTTLKGGKVGDIFVSIAPQEDETATPLELKSNSTGTANGSTTALNSGTLNWAIGGGGTLPFVVSPSSSKLANSLKDFTPVATITYTVGVGTSAQGPNLPKTDLTTIKSAVGQAVEASKVVGLLGNNITWYAKGATQSSHSNLADFDATKDWVKIEAVYSVATDTFSGTTTWTDVSSNETVKGDTLKNMTYAIAAEKVDTPPTPAPETD